MAKSSYVANLTEISMYWVPVLMALFAFCVDGKCVPFLSVSDIAFQFSRCRDIMVHTICNLRQIYFPIQN